MDMPPPQGAGPVIYACPMHPEVVSEEPATCPQCGMKLLPVEAPATTYTCPMHPEVASEEPGHCPECGMKLLPAELVDEAGGHHGHEAHAHAHEAEEHAHEAHEHAAAGGIEWEEDMVAVNRLTTPGEHALEGDRSRHRRGERGDRLAVPGRRQGQDSPTQRDGGRASDAPSDSTSTARAGSWS
jgi:Heavy metal binding domain